MALFKVAALSFGSLAICQVAAQQETTMPTGEVNTGTILDTFNLFRNARIDGGLKSLGTLTFEYKDEVGNFVHAETTGQRDTQKVTCRAANDAMTAGLLIQLDSTQTFDVKKVLDAQLTQGLEKLITQAQASTKGGSAPGTPTAEERAARNLAFLSSANATAVGCAITNGCGADAPEGKTGDAQSTPQFFFCKFQGVENPPKVTPEFANALKARKEVVSISQLTEQDANTPLHSGSSASSLVLTASAVLLSAVSAALL